MQKQLVTTHLMHSQSPLIARERDFSRVPLARAVMRVQVSLSMVRTAAPLFALLCPIALSGCDQADHARRHRGSAPPASDVERAQAARLSEASGGVESPLKSPGELRTQPLRRARGSLDLTLPGTPPTAVTAAPLPAAYCSIDVEGVSHDMETDYIAHVITCENGGANLEALKAQAIAARSVAYYAMAENGTICDGQGCQVYSCSAKPKAIHYQAAEETAGQYLSYDNPNKGRVLTYAFYVAGDNDQTASCKAVDPNAGTEPFVTYNAGKSWTDVEETTLGFQFKDPNNYGYGQNRGCMGQWSARCLENDLGYDHVEILRYFYGEDIDILKAEGPCVGETSEPPQGVLESADCDGVAGWAYDPDVGEASINVTLSFGGPVDDPEAVLAELLAGVARPDLCDQLGSCDHGFAISGQRSLRDGQLHPVHAYGHDDLEDDLIELGESPLNFACAPPTLPEGVRRVVDEPTIDAWDFDPFWQMAVVPDAVADTYPEWKPLGDAPQLIRAEGSDDLWLVDVGFRRLVPSPEVAAAWSFDPDEAALWPTEMIESLPIGTPVRSQVFLLRGDAPTVYVIDDPQCPEGGIPGDPLCPEGMETQGESASDTGDTTDSGSSGSDGTGSGSDSGGETGGDSGGDSDSSDTATGTETGEPGSVPGLPPGYGEGDDDDGGCACAVTRSPLPTAPTILALGLLAGLRRRRR